MKRIVFIGRSLKDIKSVPIKAKRETGFQLDRVQNGNAPFDWKPMPTIGSGAQEIRIKEDNGIYRIIYVAKFEGKVYVLHAFQKKTQKTSNFDLGIAKKAYKEVLEERKNEDISRIR
ncbi:hypothetical protein A9Q81_27140 [Gammaproteobacteria bacterium 42_54_T18]|nr:hypothetical protein A9Q81_27140 [Gammaproteobacteria bacterium 42_54_T18]